MGRRARMYSFAAAVGTAIALAASSCSSGAAFSKSGVADQAKFCKGAQSEQAATTDPAEIKALTAMQQASIGSLHDALKAVLADFSSSSKQGTSAWRSDVTLITSTAQNVCGINVLARPTAKPAAPAQSIGASSVPTPTAAPGTSSVPAPGSAVTLDGVTVAGATDLRGAPTVTSKGTTDPAKLAFKDLVVGNGPSAAPTSTVTVQYVGVLYEGGVTPFYSSWSHGSPAQFSLTQVVPGYATGIGGGNGAPAMKVGGRRLIIIPSALGYGSHAQGSIPANSPLVFVVDLLSVRG